MPLIFEDIRNKYNQECRRINAEKLLEFDARDWLTPIASTDEELTSTDEEFDELLEEIEKRIQARKAYENWKDERYSYEELLEFSQKEYKKFRHEEKIETLNWYRKFKLGELNMKGMKKEKMGGKKQENNGEVMKKMPKSKMGKMPKGKGGSKSKCGY